MYICTYRNKTKYTENSYQHFVLGETVLTLEEVKVASSPSGLTGDCCSLNTYRNVCHQKYIRTFMHMHISNTNKSLSMVLHTYVLHKKYHRAGSVGSGKLWQIHK